MFGFFIIKLVGFVWLPTFMCLMVGCMPSCVGVFENHEEVRQAYEVPQHGKCQVARL